MATRVLLVEGNDDQHVMYALFAAHAVPEVFEVRPIGGVESLVASVPTWLKASDIERLAIVIDADENIDTRWASLRDTLSASGHEELQQFPARAGTVVQLAAGPRLGVWLMPDNEIPGMLEDFVALLVPSGDQLLPIVDDFLAAIPVQLRLFSQKLAKARIHTWLAVQREPGKPLGQSITATYLDANAETVFPFVAWVRAALVD